MEATNSNEQPPPRLTQTPPIHSSIEIVPRAGEIDEESTDHVRPEISVRREPSEKRRYYVPVTGKFLISTTLSAVWLCASWLLAQNWLGDLAQVTGHAPAVLIIFFFSLLPGSLYAHIIATVI